jgi:hypothetical protein
VRRGGLRRKDWPIDVYSELRPYIANPDQVERLATGDPLAEVDWETVYGSGPRGYCDYPAGGGRRAAGE